MMIKTAVGLLNDTHEKFQLLLLRNIVIADIHLSVITCFMYIRSQRSVEYF